MRDPSNTVRLGIAIALFLWLALCVLTAIEGRLAGAFTLSFVGVHVRLLLALPLFFVGETLVDPRAAVFVDTLVHSGVVTPANRPRLAAEVARVRRWCNGWGIDAACLVLAAAALLYGATELLPGMVVDVDPTLAASQPLSGLWYWGVCLTVFRFVLLRWVARLAIWTFFLVRVAALELRLSPAHPDRAGGLGYLEAVQMHFLPLVFAFSAVEASTFAEGIADGTLAFEATYPIFATALAIDAVVFLGPLLIFAPALWARRDRGLSDYAVLGSEYTTGFDRKWVERGADPGEPLLGTADLQSLADLGNSSNVVREMRLVPASFQLVRNLAIAALLPVLPLLLLKYPVAELAEKFISRLSGL